MHVDVNGVRLFFDVEGAKLVPDGPSCARSRRCSCSTAAPASTTRCTSPRTRTWPTSRRSSTSTIAATAAASRPEGELELAQWGDDVRAFCEALGIDDPIVLGVSFGGMVAMAYATRHPAHPAKLILSAPSRRRLAISSGVSRCSSAWRAGGRRAGAPPLPRDRGPADQAALDAWRRLAMPLYTRMPRDPDSCAARSSGRKCCTGSRGPGGESHRFNMFPDLERIHARPW